MDATPSDLLMQVEDIAGKTNPTEAVPKLQAIQKQLAQMDAAAGEKGNPKVEVALRMVSEAIKESYDRVIGVKAFAGSGKTYVRSSREDEL